MNEQERGGNEGNQVAGMKEIRCPNCGTTVPVDDLTYAGIVKQIRDAEFERELVSRQDLAVRTALSEAKLESSREIQGLQAKVRELELAADGAARDAEARHEVETARLRSEYEAELRGKDAEIAFYRDFKARQSTKAIGESLELHCETEFNRVRAIAFPGAYFEKDNAVSQSGSKGDYIFRDFSGSGEELVSIMFEMKNETDDSGARTTRKHRNEDFFKELDKDRREKGCEYAILVSLLEPDSDLYNQGIVDVSHRYPKMYVIRPQFFVPVIGFLRNEAMKSMDLRRELADARDQNVDILKFESDLDAFKTKFMRNVETSRSKFDAVLSQLDKAIGLLEKARDDLKSCDRNLRLAGDKADGLDFPKLVRGNPSMAAVYESQASGGR